MGPQDQKRRKWKTAEVQSSTCGKRIPTDRGSALLRNILSHRLLYITNMRSIHVSPEVRSKAAILANYAYDTGDKFRAVTELTIGTKENKLIGGNRDQKKVSNFGKVTTEE